MKYDHLPKEKVTESQGQKRLLRLPSSRPHLTDVETKLRAREVPKVTRQVVLKFGLEARSHTLNLVLRPPPQASRAVNLSNNSKYRVFITYRKTKGPGWCGSMD